MTGLLILMVALFGALAGGMYCACTGEDEIEKIILYIAVPALLCVIFSIIFLGIVDGFETLS